MYAYILKRVLWSVPFLFAVSLLAFAIMQLPPGDFVTSYAAKLTADGQTVDPARLDAMRERFGLDQPFLVQYWKWITGVIQGDFGLSFQWQLPVSELIGDRLLLSICLATSTLLFTWSIALPIGIFSAVKQYSIGDYVFSFIGFIGLATPNFLIALVLMYLGVTVFGTNITGLFSAEYANAPWSWGKIVDLLSHLFIPIVIIGASSTASLIRIMRANLLDELYKPYVTTARAKGLTRFKAIMKYPVRIALNPFASTIAWVLPQIISGSTIVAVVLSLPTVDPLMLSALLAEDMYLAGAFILLLCVLSIVGMILSDIVLAFIDPRIRFR